ncbi:MAG: cyclopropane-fatty-acyl-phospholipid synthase family protein [Syntrophobacteraceae bacterium]|jgi:cyclopropane-fatty-acyl-phospholipid synthase|nr:cyclopropane-fatty-acyl-phospholipid synthase family protein [Syntrophobacteraceae bacterium]
MNGTIIPHGAPWPARIRTGPLDRLARRLVLQRLESLKVGDLTLKEGGQQISFGGGHGGDGVSAEIDVLHPRFYSSVAYGGSIGAGEAYMAGTWTARDLTMAIRVIVRNRSLMEAMDRGLSKVLTRTAHRLYHFTRRNTENGSLANIAAHYDLGNEFYALFLDETLTYSCGIFEGPDSTLEQASRAKYDRICRKLRLSPEDHVLEVGSGWGGFAIHAARHYGCRVTTTTISRSQHDLARQRIHEAGLQDRIQLLFEDYRHLRGKYDKLVSIEMIEAVGHQYLGDFLRCCGERLKDDGAMVLQAITVSEQDFEQHSRSVDFIKRYIFPGGCLTSVAAICRGVAECTDLRPVHLEDIATHYARTLRIWRERFFARLDDVRRMGYPDVFIRMWEFYLCYCEAGFQERYLGNVQMVFHKPLCRQEPVLAIPSV